MEFKTKFWNKWWKDLNLAEEFLYMRDRLVETYLWAIGNYFEPHYAFSRATITKYTVMVSAVNDTYHAYGTIDELRCFTKAFLKGDFDAIDGVPEYMKVLYKVLLKFFNQIEAEGRSYRTSFANEAFKELVKAYIVEAQWFSDGYVPLFDEYMRNGLITSGYRVLPAASFIGMEKTVVAEEHKWVQSNPKVVRVAQMIGRLMNDIASHEDEQKRGHCVSAIEFGDNKPPNQLKGLESLPCLVYTISHLPINLRTIRQSRNNTTVFAKHIRAC
ncbi:casbene synthase, putative [Ricinus communis]|uniref:Casbene synthase, putative n=1 Tax=Ricinus communis TaxID=3988 RepID=B9SJ11_RICCO|nr:casbene synthase, putative [Ricinus communis]